MAAGWEVLDAPLLSPIPAFNPPLFFWQGSLPFLTVAGLASWKRWPTLRPLNEPTARTSRRELLLIAELLIMLLTAQHLYGYLAATLGRVASLDSLAELARHRDARYFRLRKWAVDNRGIKYGAYAISSSYKVAFTHIPYLTCPLLAGPADTAQAPPVPAWLGFQFASSTRGRLPQAARDIV